MSDRLSTPHAGAARGGELTAAFEHCRRIAAAHGRTYYLATRLLMELGRD